MAQPQYLVQINTPGMVLVLPHSGKTIRTPHDCIIDEEWINQYECMFKLRAIHDFAIDQLTKEEVLDFERQLAESNAKGPLPRKSLKRHRTSLAIEGVIRRQYGR